MDIVTQTLIPAACLGALGTLIALTIIDLKVRLLPNTYVFAFALFGIGFHAATRFYFLSGIEMIGGMIMGGGLLYTVRFVANQIYNQDSLGLGDVKLMMVGGLWLGPSDILSSIIIGACAGIMHGLSMAWIKKMKTGEPVNLSRFYLPAGPGFIIGLLVVAIYKFYTLPSIVWP